MKQILLLALLLLTTGGLFAQGKKIAPSYWVVETNVNQRNYSIVRLYDLSNKLVHEVRMDDVYFNIKKRRHQKMMNQLLKGDYERADVTARKIEKISQGRRMGS